MVQIKEVMNSQGIKVFELSGVIDEYADFKPLLNEDSEIHVDGQLITRINSVGVKMWLRCFQQIRDSKKPLFFYRISPVVVEQMNVINQFNCGGTVVSVTLPFHCLSCKEPSFFIKTKSELAGVNLDATGWACEHCGKTTLEFDDIPQGYLHFWK